MNGANKELLKIGREIFQCRKCEFYKELDSNENFHPDPPSIPDLEKTHKAMVIGVNPGMDVDQSDPLYIKCMEQQTFEEYSEQCVISSERGGRNPYRDHVASIFNLLNDEMGIYDDKNIRSEDIYNYIFWSNLAFCPSQKIDHRTINGLTIKNFDIFNTEIPNCVEQGFLERLIELKNPEFIIILGIEVLKYYGNDPRPLIKRLVGITEDEEIETYEKFRFPYQVNSGKTTYTSARAYKIKRSGIKVLFFPHPNSQYRGEFRNKVLSELGSWLK